MRKTAKYCGLTRLIDAMEGLEEGLPKISNPMIHPFCGGVASVEIAAVVVQPDGKVVVGGSFETFNGASRHLLTRLNADGSLDNSYNPGTNSNLNIEYGVSTLLLQPDGSLLVGGCGGTMLARLNPQ